MKNLEFALKVLAKVKVPVTFNIFGPTEDYKYWESCLKVIGSLPVHIKVHYGGPVMPDRVIDTIRMHNLFFLPTLGENFGHVFVEAWCAGVPVLTSDRTPWRGLISRNLGWDFSLEDEDSFIDAIHDAAIWSVKQQDFIRSACQSFAHEIMTDTMVIEANRNIILSVIRKQK
jgi:glycosyltransferase involved in cell wall biosynthesis